MSKNKYWNKDAEVKTNEQPDTSETSLEAETNAESLETAIKEAELKGIETVLDILYYHPKNMMDDAYSTDTRMVADWVKTKLRQKGYKV